jgi:hypothetical protein
LASVNLILDPDPDLLFADQQAPARGHRHGVIREQSQDRVDITRRQGGFAGLQY